MKQLTIVIILVATVAIAIRAHSAAAAGTSPTAASDRSDAASLANLIQFGPEPPVRRSSASALAVASITNTDTQAHTVVVRADFYDAPTTALPANPATGLVASGR